MEESGALERALAALLLLGVAAVARLESRSNVAQDLLRRRPIWAVYAGDGQEVPAVLQPARGLLDLVAWPQGTAPPAPRLSIPAPAPAPAGPGERLLDFKSRLLDRRRGLRPWRDLAGRFIARRPLDPAAALDHILWELELSKIGPRGIRAVELPAGPAQTSFLARRLAAEAADGRPVTVEVLNATGVKGIALKATKVLRLAGADVIAIGNAGASHPTTVVYDRAGRPDRAMAVLESLGCASAELLTRREPKGLAEAAVVLQDDCVPALTEGPGEE